MTFPPAQRGQEKKEFQPGEKTHSHHPVEKLSEKLS